MIACHNRDSYQPPFPTISHVRYHGLSGGCREADQAAMATANDWYRQHHGRRSFSFTLDGKRYHLTASRRHWPGGNPNPYVQITVRGPAMELEYDASS